MGRSYQFVGYLWVEPSEKLMYKFKLYIGWHVPVWAVPEEGRILEVGKSVCETIFPRARHPSPPLWGFSCWRADAVIRGNKCPIPVRQISRVNPQPPQPYMLQPLDFARD